MNVRQARVALAALEARGMGEVELRVYDPHDDTNAIVMSIEDDDGPVIKIEEG